VLFLSIQRSDEAQVDAFYTITLCYLCLVVWLSQLALEMSLSKSTGKINEGPAWRNFIKILAKIKDKANSNNYVVNLHTEITP
jgi:hypothetical protein